MTLHPLCTHKDDGSFCMKCQPFKASELFAQVNGDPRIRAELLRQRLEICGVCGGAITFKEPRWCKQCDGRPAPKGVRP